MPNRASSSPVVDREIQQQLRLLYQRRSAIDRLIHSLLVYNALSRSEAVMPAAEVEAGPSRQKGIQSA